MRYLDFFRGRRPCRGYVPLNLEGLIIIDTFKLRVKASLVLCICVTPITSAGILISLAFFSIVTIGVNVCD